MFAAKLSCKADSKTLVPFASVVLSAIVRVLCSSPSANSAAFSISPVVQVLLHTTCNIRSKVMLVSVMFVTIISMQNKLGLCGGQTIDSIASS